MVLAWGVGIVAWLLIAAAVAVTVGRSVRLADHRSSSGAAPAWSDDVPQPTPRSTAALVSASS